jgi:hypothetical protein
MAEADDRALVRRFIARELETINEYEQFAAQATSPALKRFFEHVAQEEREHVAEGMHELLALDPAQQAIVDYHEAHAVPKTPAAAAPRDGAGAEVVLKGYTRLTVGSLRARGSQP